jgi:hypothetical protein
MRAYSTIKYKQLPGECVYSYLKADEFVSRARKVIGSMLYLNVTCKGQKEVQTDYPHFWHHS